MIQRTEDGGRKAERVAAGAVLRSASTFCLLSSVLCLLASCAYYSFSGAALPEHLATIAIPLAEDRSVGGVPALDQVLTDLLVERFARQTRLALEPDENAADALLTAVIERYQNAPVAVTGAEVAALNRVSLTVAVRFFDRAEERERLVRTFTASAEYDAALIDQEEVAAAAALEQVADDAFTAATSEW